MTSVVYKSLERLKSITTYFLIICILLECIIYPSLETLFGCFVEISGWLLISKTVIKGGYLRRYFIPFIMIFSLGVCFFVLPIPATLVEGKPLTFRFKVPYLTFFNLMLNVITIVTAFHACRCIYREGWLNNLWKKCGFFYSPTPKQLWTFAFLGFGALLWLVSIQGTDAQQSENLGITGQFLGELSNYAYIPIVFFFVSYWGTNKQIPYLKKYVLIYMVMLLFIAIATTRRELLFSAFVSWAVMFFFTMLMEDRKIFTTKSALLVIIGIYLMTGPVADLATAMIISRSSVYNSKASSTFSQVMKLYSDKELLHNAFKMGTFSNTDNGGDNLSAWSEYYLDNIILDRFCNLRTQDISLDYAKRLGYGSKRMQDYAEKFMLYQVPTPLLRVFGYKGNKFDFQYTPGDLLSTDILGYREQYKGLRVSGDSAVGLAWMGYSYYPFAFVLYVLLFYFLSSLVTTKGRLIIPVPVIIALTSYMWFFNNSIGIFRTIRFLVRSGWQSVLVYCVIMYIIKKILR